MQRLDRGLRMHGNTTTDMVDANASCDSDLWFFNAFTNVLAVVH